VFRRSGAAANRRDYGRLDSASLSQTKARWVAAAYAVRTGSLGPSGRAATAFLPKL
jgi:hypothetical protein